MSKILKVSQSDYRVKVKDTGTITLDTGVDVGTVVITGNLLVKGEQTTVNTTNLDIEDNTITLNKGEGGVGVTEGFSGLQVDRGSLDDAQFIWKESVQKFLIQTIDGNGTGTLSGIVVGDISTNPTTNLNIDMQNGSGVLHITNSTGYEGRVLDPDDIPNKQFVNDYVLAYDGYAVVDKIFYPITSSGNEDTLVQSLASSIRFSVKSGGTLNQRMQITSQGLTVDNVNTFGTTIRNSSVTPGITGGNLILQPATTSYAVQVDGTLELTDRTDPTSTGGASRIYSKTTAGPGKTGIYFTNNTATDELVSRNRAVLLSILL
jgi:hypothetical protein